MRTHNQLAFTPTRSLVRIPVSRGSAGGEVVSLASPSHSEAEEAAQADSWLRFRLEQDTGHIPTSDKVGWPGIGFAVWAAYGNGGAAAKSAPLPWWFRSGRLVVPAPVVVSILVAAVVSVMVPVPVMVTVVVVVVVVRALAVVSGLESAGEDLSYAHGRGSSLDRLGVAWPAT
jgi:hypothetical protein